MENAVKKPIIVNLFGAPGSGKSTGAAYIFSQLKLRGINVEYLTEFAKDKTWEKNKKALDDQLYILGESYHKLFICKDQVDVIILDSPLLLSLLYNNDPLLDTSFTQLVKNLYNSFTNLNFLVNRVKPYNPKGRNETEEESNNLRYKLINILEDMGNYDCVEINGDMYGYNTALEIIVKFLKNCNITSCISN